MMDIAPGLTEGTYTVLVTVSDVNGSATFSISVNVSPDTAVKPTITTTALPGGTVGTAYPSTTVQATGDPTITWSASGFPAGLTISSSGVILGMPTVNGTFASVIVTAKNKAGTATKTYTIVIAPAAPPAPSAPAAPTLTGPPALTLQAGYVATPVGVYTVTGTEPVTASKTSGNASITWDSKTMMLDITAGLVAGSYPVVLTASNGTAPDAMLTFTLKVTAAPPVPVVPTITGPTTMTLTAGYASVSAGAYTVTGTASPEVTDTPQQRQSQIPSNLSQS